MKRIMVSVIVIFIFLSGCIFQSTAPSVEIVSITTDKKVYHSRDHMRINVLLKSSDTLENVTINTAGIKNKYGKIMLHKSMVVDLKGGINNITFSYTLPICSTCKGLEAGIYEIHVTVVYKEKMLANGTINVELRQ